MNLSGKKVLSVIAFSMAASMAFTGTMASYTSGEYNSIFAVEATAADKLFDSVIGNTRCEIVNDGTTTFNMNGRTYSQGVILGNGSYSDGAEISFDVTGMEQISFSIGHIDDTSGDSAKLTIYLDEDVYDVLSLERDELSEGYVVKTNGASSMRIVRDGSVSKYAIADISVDSDDTHTYTVPEYSTSASFINKIYNSTRCEVFDETDSDKKFRMLGRTYSNGIILGDGGYSEGAEFSVNVESVDKINLTIGHVDNTYLGDINIEIYLDGVLDDRIALSPNEVVPYEIKTENVSVLRIERTGSVSRYAVADITFDGITPENTYRVPNYRTSSAFVSDIFNSYRTEVFDGSSSAFSFNMNGRSYHQGIIVGDGSYSEGAAFSLNVENIDKITCDLGHVDNTNSSEAVLSVFLDGKKSRQIKLSQNNPIIEDYEIDVSSAKVLRIERDGSQSRYALGNIVTEKLAPKNSVSIPEYKSSALFLESKFDSYRTSIYDGISDVDGFNMQGREYYQGIILGDGSYSTGSGISFNVENLSSISFDLGHVDNSSTNSAVFHIYLDNEEVKEIELSYQKPIEPCEFDLSSADTMRIYCDGSQSRYAMANIIVDEIAPKHSFSVPEYETAADFISSNYDTFRSEFYDGDDQFKTFTVDGKEYSLGFILGDTSYSSGAAVSFNVEKLDEVSFSMGVIGENQNSKEKLYIYKDGKQTEEILLTPENIAKMKNYTIDTRGVSTIRIYKDSDRTRYGFTEISVKPASQPDEPEITTTAVTTTPPVSVTTEPSVTTPPENVTTPPETTVTAMTTTTVTDTSEYDLNGDGKLSTSDVRCLLQHLVGSFTLKEEALKKADINKDGSVDTADAVKLLRKAAGMTETE